MPLGLAAGVVPSEVALLTGATGGIGRVVAGRLAADGRTVVLTDRDRTAGERLAAEVAAASPDATTRFLRADLADHEAIRGLATDVRADYDRLDLLVNNAGAAPDERHLTDDGVELTFAVNYLAPFLLTNLLAPRLRESAPATVLTTTSFLHREGDLSDVESVVAGRDFDGRQAYANSKLAIVLFTYELAARLADAGVAATCFTPGWVPSTGIFGDLSVPVRAFMRAASAVAARLPIGLLETPETAGAALAHVATDADLPAGTGSYFAGREPEEPAPAARDERLRERLWARSADLVDLPPAVPAVDPLA